MAEGKNKPRLIVRLTAYALSAVLLAAILVLVEAGSWNLLRLRGETSYPLFFIPGENAPGRLVPYRPKFEWLDPHLGHAHSVEFLQDRLPDFAVMPGFVAYGDPDNHDALRIFALGGSTTDASFGKAWPYFLQRELDALSIDAVVFNGGAGGYSSNQELLKLVRDVLPLEPDIVLSLSGINDVGFFTSHTGHPMVHTYQAQVFESIVGKPQPFRFFPNTTVIVQRLLPAREDGVQGVSYGPEVQTTPGQQWTRNVRLMHAVAQSSGADYLCFRQPVLGIGAYSPSPEEKAMLENYNYTVIRDGRPVTYYDLLTDFYRETKDTADTLPYCVDFIDVFENEQGIYRDARHQTVHGCQVLARAIARVLQRRGLLPRDQISPGN